MTEGPRTGVDHPRAWPPCSPTTASASPSSACVALLAASCAGAASAGAAPAAPQCSMRKQRHRLAGRAQRHAQAPAAAHRLRHDRLAGQGLGAPRHRVDFASTAPSSRPTRARPSRNGLDTTELANGTTPSPRPPTPRSKPASRRSPSTCRTPRPHLHRPDARACPGTRTGTAPAPAPAPEPAPAPAPAPTPAASSIYWGAWIGKQLTGDQPPWDMSAADQVRGNGRQEALDHQLLRPLRQLPDLRRLLQLLQLPGQRDEHDPRPRLDPLLQLGLAVDPLDHRTSPTSSSPT